MFPRSVPSLRVLFGGPLCVVLTVVFGLPNAVLADTVGVRWVDTQFSGENATSAERGAQIALTEASPLVAKDVPGTIKRACAQDKKCLEKVAEAAGVDHLLLLRGRQSGSRLWVDGLWWEAWNKNLKVHLERDIPSPEEGARSVVQALVPVYARRGFAGMTVTGDKGLTVKVDGRRVGVTPLDAPVVLPAGQHALDVIDGTGRSVLVQKTLEEGQRVPVEFAATQFDFDEAPRRSQARLWTSYGLWAAGALAIAGGFIAGREARAKNADIIPCNDGNRADCTGADEAQRLGDQSDRYARTGNILFGTGGGLLAVGTGLFFWTWFHPTETTGPDAAGAR